MSANVRPRRSKRARHNCPLTQPCPPWWGLGEETEAQREAGQQAAQTPQPGLVSVEEIFARIHSFHHKGLGTCDLGSSVLQTSWWSL